MGIFCIWYSVASPISHQNTFTQHMLCHLLFGMLAPLLLVLSAPMTLILRILKTPHARDLSHLLKCIPIRILAHPAVAAFFYIAGLVLLYTTELYTLMHQYFLIYLLIHFHLLVAGYLFTASIIYIDPVPHRYSFLYRSTVCFLTLTVHAILSKYIYAHPPANVPLEQAKSGAMIMYYGGDMIDAVLIYILCYQWFYAVRNPARRRLTLNSSP
jgi:putative membrane protein